MIMSSDGVDEFIALAKGEQAQKIKRLQQQLEQQAKSIDELEKGFKFAYENGTFYPAAFKVLDPIYAEYIETENQ